MKLDQTSTYKKLDQGFVGESLSLLPKQMRQVLDEADSIIIPSSYREATSIAVAGMGGSNLGTHFTRSAWGEELTVPISIVAAYHLPRYVNKKTFLLLSSYSGTTEETLSVVKEGKKRGSLLAVISEDAPGSELKRIAHRYRLPGYFFKPKANPSGQPRLGLGYSIFGQALILGKAGFFPLDMKKMNSVVSRLEILNKKLMPSAATDINPAKQLALAVHRRSPILVGAEHIVGNLPVMRNQINESSKQLSAYLEIPDMNHHALEGLGFPRSNKLTLAFVLFLSKFYDKRVARRFTLTKQVVEQNGIPAYMYRLTSMNRLAESFELLQLGAWISYYLGILNQVDPVKIPFVDWFKNQLKK